MLVSIEFDEGADVVEWVLRDGDVAEMHRCLADPNEPALTKAELDEELRPLSYIADNNPDAARRATAAYAPGSTRWQRWTLSPWGAQAWWRARVN
jgi:hypothetical protein